MIIACLLVIAVQLIYIMRSEEEQALQRWLQRVPPSIQVQFEILRYHKMLKVKISTKYPIHHYLPLFSAKFDSDFATFRITATLRLSGARRDVRTDLPMRYIVAEHFRVVPVDPVICEINIAYEGG